MRAAKLGLAALLASIGGIGSASAADILLVINEETTPREIEAWKTAGKWVAMDVEPLDVRNLPDGSPQQLLTDPSLKTVVVLNNELSLNPSTRARADHLLGGPDFLRAASRRGVRTYYVGMNPYDSSHLFRSYLLPSIENRTTHFGSLESFFSDLDGELRESREVHSGSNTGTSAEIVEVQHARRRGQGRPETDDLRRAAEKAQRELQAANPDRRYYVTYEFEPKQTKRSWGVSTWKLGELQISRGADLSDVSAVSYHAYPAEMHTPEFILDQANLYPLLAATPFEHKLALFDRILAENSPTQDLAFVNEGVGNALVDAMVTDLATEQRALLQAPRDRLYSEEELRAKLPCLDALAQRQMPRLKVLNSVSGRLLVRFVAETRHLAASHLSGWDRLFHSHGAKRGVYRKATRILRDFVTFTFKGSNRTFEKAVRRELKRVSLRADDPAWRAQQERFFTDAGSATDPKDRIYDNTQVTEKWSREAKTYADRQRQKRAAEQALEQRAREQHALSALRVQDEFDADATRVDLRSPETITRPNELNAHASVDQRESVESDVRAATRAARAAERR